MDMLKVVTVKGEKFRVRLKPTEEGEPLWLDFDHLESEHEEEFTLIKSNLLRDAFWGRYNGLVISLLNPNPGGAA